MSGHRRSVLQEIWSTQTLREQNPEVGGVLQLKKGQRNIYYLVTKRHSRDKPSYEDVWKSLTKLRDTMVDQNLADLAIPKLSCGIDGLDWRVIRSMLGIFRSSGSGFWFAVTLFHDRS
ncbi:hypothetical protein JTB14_006380 [Gonioctena quinquepunctata]|nr:hypothetical protein JTB14_006380 [Gonioctena quinquepunctata]